MFTLWYFPVSLFLRAYGKYFGRVLSGVVSTVYISISQVQTPLKSNHTKYKALAEKINAPEQLTPNAVQ